MLDKSVHFFPLDGPAGWRMLDVGPLGSKRELKSLGDGQN